MSDPHVLDDGGLPVRLRRAWIVLVYIAVVVTVVLWIVARSGS